MTRHTGLAALVAAAVLALGGSCSKIPAYTLKYNPTDKLVLNLGEDSDNPVTTMKAEGDDRPFWQRSLTACVSTRGGITYAITDPRTAHEACGGPFRTYLVDAYERIGANISERTEEFLTILRWGSGNPDSPIYVNVTPNGSVTLNNVKSVTEYEFHGVTTGWIMSVPTTYNVTIQNGTLNTFDMNGPGITLSYTSGTSFNLSQSGTEGTYTIDINPLPPPEEQEIQKYFGAFSKNVLQVLANRTRSTIAMPDK